MSLGIRPLPVCLEGRGSFLYVCRSVSVYAAVRGREKPRREDSPPLPSLRHSVATLGRLILAQGLDQNAQETLQCHLDQGGGAPAEELDLNPYH